jgi:AcrR family transcriptional regulator
MADVQLTTGRARRSDAERNRDRVLRAARQHVREHGMRSLTMDLLAAKAGVGKGTLYRGFGSRAGVAEALLDDAERELQERILTGPPPLGHGATPRQRLAAFVAAYVEFLDANAELVVATERGSQGGRFHNGAYAFWHAHVAGLLRLRRRDAPDPDVEADLVLAMLAADLFQHLREGEVPADRIAAAVVARLD